jgi:uncharacterized protein (DUF2126 family)
VNLAIVMLLLLLAALVVFFVSAPLRNSAAAQQETAVGAGPLAGERAAKDQAAVRDDLEAAREAKYREIRDAELDFRTGKLSQADYEAIDADLRAEALEILNRLQELDAEAP